MERKELIHKFNKQARKYERKRKKQEKNKYRKKIFHSVRGKTLEVAVGAGMNFSFYSKSIEYIGVDFSPNMIEKAKEAARDHDIKAEFILSDVESLGFGENEFDTIISSGSLCGYEDPVYVLNLFNNWCKRDGQILLFEHGVFSNPFLAWMQEKLDPLALEIVGCHQSRNVEDIVKKSNLEIEKIERHIMGYLYLIWAKPSKESPEAGSFSFLQRQVL